MLLGSGLVQILTCERGANEFANLHESSNLHLECATGGRTSPWNAVMQVSWFSAELSRKSHYPAPLLDSRPLATPVPCLEIPLLIYLFSVLIPLPLSSAHAGTRS